MSDREALADLLMQMYDHGAQPNAFREADVLLASEWLAEHDRQEREKAWDEGLDAFPLDPGRSNWPDNPYRKQEPNVVGPERAQERESLLQSFDTRGNGVIHPRDAERLAEFDRETERLSSRIGAGDE